MLKPKILHTSAAWLIGISLIFLMISPNLIPAYSAGPSELNRMMKAPPFSEVLTAIPAKDFLIVLPFLVIKK